MKITANQSAGERFLRIIIGGIFTLATTYLPMGAGWSGLFLAIGLILMLTGLSGYCPLYASLKLNTNKI